MRHRAVSAGLSYGPSPVLSTERAGGRGRWGANEVGLAERVRAEVDRLASADLWPGFDPRRVPLAIYDGSATYLFSFPGRPPGFADPAGPDRPLVHPGLHPAVRANTAAELDGVAVATVMLEPDDPRSVTELAALAIHEAFHVVQRERHPDWGANEADLFAYPATDARLLGLARLEVDALARALGGQGGARGAWARGALGLRRGRFAAMPEAAVAYERGTELVEGLATYVERRALDRPAATLLAATGFGPGEVRRRCYATGAAMASLLDRAAPAWRERVEAGEIEVLDALLAAALPPGSLRAGFSPRRRAEAFARAEAAVADLVATRRAAREAELARPGWRLVVEADAGTPLWPRGFDPMNVQLVGEGEVLHTRYLVLGNETAALELLDRAALTQAAGEHPLFGGVRRVVVAGLPAAPEVRRTGVAAAVEAPGCRGEFAAARVEHSGEALIVRVVGGTESARAAGESPR